MIVVSGVERTTGQREEKGTKCWETNDEGSGILVEVWYQVEREKETFNIRVWSGVEESGVCGGRGGGVASE